MNGCLSMSLSVSPVIYSVLTRLNPFLRPKQLGQASALQKAQLNEPYAVCVRYVIDLSTVTPSAWVSLMSTSITVCSTGLCVCARCVHLHRESARR